MGTISERKRRNGRKSYTAQIRIRREGQIVHSEAQTFERKAAASAWLKKRETELAQPGALDAAKKPAVTLADAIQKYLDTSRMAIGRTKAHVLDTILRHPLAQTRCADITSADISAFALDLAEGWTADGGEQRPRQPQTVGNYLSHLGAVFAVAKPMWGYDLDRSAFQDATVVNKRLGVIQKSKSRDRRPSRDELDRILTHFKDRSARAPTTIPMVEIILFALFSTRRQEEITRILWHDFQEDEKRVLVRDMKHPGQKQGNDQWCDLPARALNVILSMPRDSDRIFPCSADAISAAFTRACHVLGIEDLHFHDLRHDGVSLLFEQGLSIPHVAAVSGHRSWASLKRYTHLRQVGDKYAGWAWLPMDPAHDPQQDST